MWGNNVVKLRTVMLIKFRIVLSNLKFHLCNKRITLYFAIFPNRNIFVGAIRCSTFFNITIMRTKTRNSSIVYNVIFFYKLNNKYTVLFSRSPPSFGLAVSRPK